MVALSLPPEPIHPTSHRIGSKAMRTIATFITIFVAAFSTFIAYEAYLGTFTDDNVQWARFIVDGVVLAGAIATFAVWIARPIRHAARQLKTASQAYAKTCLQQSAVAPMLQSHTTTDTAANAV